MATPSGTTCGEFKKRLDQPRGVISRGLAQYAVWKALFLHEEGKAALSLEETNMLLGRFKGFFIPTGLAIRDETFMQFSKVFDEYPGTVSLTNLLAAARRNPSQVPNADKIKLGAISKLINQNKAAIKKLKGIRNRRLAHTDPDPKTLPLPKNEFDSLVEAAKQAFNSLSSAHDGKVYDWDYPLQRSEERTTEVLGILLRDMRRAFKAHGDKMVRLALEEIRHGEKMLGRRLSKEEVQSVNQSYALTEKEMRRVEAELGLS